MPSRTRRGKAKRGKGANKNNDVSASSSSSSASPSPQQLIEQKKRQTEQDVLHRLLLNNLSLEETMKICEHGFINRPIKCGTTDRCYCPKKFVDAYDQTLNETFDKGVDILVTHPKILDIMAEKGFGYGAKDTEKNNMILDGLVALGTTYLLKEKDEHICGNCTTCQPKVAAAKAMIVALTIIHIEHNNGMELASRYRLEMDLLENGERGAIGFFAKRVQCSCLKAKYKKVKLLQKKKIGRCEFCNQMREIRDLLYW